MPTATSRRLGVRLIVRPRAEEIQVASDVTVQHALGHPTPTITLDTYSHLWPQAEDGTRAAAASLWRSADSPRTEAPIQAGDLHAQR